MHLISDQTKHAKSLPKAILTPSIETIFLNPNAIDRGRRVNHLIYTQSRENPGAHKQSEVEFRLLN